MQRFTGQAPRYHGRPDKTLAGESPFGHLVNDLFSTEDVRQCCTRLFEGLPGITDELVARVAEADNELFLADPLHDVLTEDQAAKAIDLLRLLVASVTRQSGRLTDDVYFDAAAFRKDPLRYLGSHPFIRKAVMQAQAGYYSSFFPYAVNINVESGHKSKGTPGFYLSQRREKVGIYRSDWFYMPVDEIRSFILSTVRQHTRTLPGYEFCDMVRTAGVGTVDLVETRSSSSVYRFCETNTVCQQFTDGNRRRFLDGMAQYRSARPLDDPQVRYKCASVKMAWQTDRHKLVCRYLEPPYADVQVLFGPGGYTLSPLHWYQPSDLETQARVLAYINKKINKYGRFLPFQKYLAYET